MRLIINSYLKTFIKNWLTTVGILLFIIMLGAIVLGMMTTPLQLNAHINKVSRQTTKYDYQIKDGKKYSKDFSYNYFLLNGTKYTESTNGTTVLIQPDGFTKIAPDTLRTSLDAWKAETNWDQPTYLSKPLYLAIDQIMTKYLEDSKKPPDLEGKDWTEILNPTMLDNPNLSAEAKQYIDDSGTFLGDIIYSYVILGQLSANQSLESLDLIPFDNRKTEIKQLVIDDLKQNLTAQQLRLTTTHQLYIANNFLKVNMTNYQPITSLNELTIDKLADRTSLNLTGINTFDVHFWNLIAPEQNNVNAYLFQNIFHNPKNKNAINEDGNFAFSLITSVEYTLSQNKPGLLTPEFSVDIRTADPNAKVNELILNKGHFPQWVDNGVPEIVLSSGFMEKNGLRIGELVYLPASSFAGNIDKNQDLTSYITASRQQFQIVGTGERYDELTPGTGFTSFAQDFKTYTYAYLPSNFTTAYKKASFIYGATNNKTYKLLLKFRIKNNESSFSPRPAFDIDFVTSQSIFENSPTLLKSLSDLSTVVKLNNINIQVVVYNVLGLLCLILAFIFINFIIKKEVNETRRQLGIFKSFGYKTSELSLIFAIKTLITISIGMVIGWLCSFPIQIYMGSNFESAVIFSYQSIYFNPVLIAAVFLLVPGLFMLISYLITLKYLNESALSLISNSNRISKHVPKMGPISRKLSEKGKGFNYRLRRSFVKRAMGKFVVVQILFGFSALLYTLMFGAQALMYQAIEQGFGVLKDDTDHEYMWTNRNELVINQTTDGKYSMANLATYDDAKVANKIDYLDNSAYENTNIAMSQDSQISALFSDARYRFRVLTDTLSNSIVDQNQDPDNPDNWLILPTKIAEQKFVAGEETDPTEIISTNYYLYKLIIFKGLNDENQDFNQEVDDMPTKNEPYQGTLANLGSNYPNLFMDLQDLIKIGMGGEEGQKIIQQTLFGMLDALKINGQELSNNLFLTDLSRILSMTFAEQYATKVLQKKLNEISKPDANGKYPKEKVIEALKIVYHQARTDSNSILNQYDPRKSTFWRVMDNPLIRDDSGNGSETPPAGGTDLGDLLNNLDPSILGILTSAMLANRNDDLLHESVINFNKFFYNKNKEHLQLLIDVLPNGEYDVGDLKLSLIDVKNQHFGDARREFNYDGVSNTAYHKLAEKPTGKNTFNAIIPYAVAKRLKLKVDDTLELLTSTQSKQPIHLKIVGINKSITMPISLSWTINVDYSVFVDEMFSAELKEKIGLGQSQIAQPYLFNSLVSQNPMLSGTFKLENIPESLKSFKFNGDQLTINAQKGTSILGSMFSSLIGNTGMGGSLDKIKLQIDKQMTLVTNPMMMSADKSTLVAMPYNIAKNGVYNFTQTMMQIMIVFLLLQSILLTIILVVIMNIVVDESTVIILTLRSLGYLPKEINWIVMGSYVIWTIISFAIAYALSLIMWRVFLILAANLWRIYVFLPFDWKTLVIPILVLSFIMFVGWMVSNYQVNRRPLTLVTNFS